MTGFDILKKNHFSKEEIEYIEYSFEVLSESYRVDIFDAEYESTRQFKENWTKWLRTIGGTTVSAKQSLTEIKSAMYKLVSECIDIDSDIKSQYAEYLNNISEDEEDDDIGHLSAKLIQDMRSHTRECLIRHLAN